MLVAVGAWLWPIGFGGMMPIGGDVTNFAIGLMDVFRVALRSGRLPLWNDLWGFGFPGLAESQMGVFYPPHWPLYGLLSTEAAFTWSLTLHALWAAAGTYWMARRMGTSPRGAALAGFSWAGSGLSLIHLAHHWYFPTMSWMPWAWGLTWTLGAGRAGRRTAAMLAAVLALQVTLGHFQLAFTTQVGVLILASWGLVDRRCDRGKAAIGAGMAVLAVLSGLVLAAAQTWPTYQHARLTDAQRTAEYTSGLASPPTHYVNLVAPGLFQRSALWRAVAWDPFRAMPEEHLPYIGLVPLFLALGAIGTGVRRDPAARALGLVALAAFLFALGPFTPAFVAWSRLPGFSYFRAPARWNVAALLALSVLAGRGLDSWRGWRRPGRSLVVFTIVAAALPALAILGFEAALAGSGGAERTPVRAAFDRAFRLVPWARQGDYDRIMRSARADSHDTGTLVRLVREGYTLARAEHLRLEVERFEVYARELHEAAGLAVGLLVAALLASRRPRAAEAALLALAVADLLILSRHRLVDVAPIRSLVAQSPVLSRLASGPRGERTVDGLKNLPMIASAAPVDAFRTLDRPAVPALVSAASGAPGRPETREAIRAIGASVRIFEPMDPRSVEAVGPVERIADPALASWIYGGRWSASPEGARFRTFTLWRPNAEPSRAWFVAPGGRGGEALEPTSDPARILSVNGHARPLAVRSDVPERLDLSVASDGPGTVILSQLDDPEWSASLDGPGGRRPAPIRPIFGTREAGAWQAVDIPGAGSWGVRLRYEGRAARVGMKVSALACLLWLVAFALPGRAPIAARPGASERSVP